MQLPLVSNAQIMDNQTQSKTVKPWTVISILEGKKHIVQRFKRMYDANCYASQLQQNSINGTTYVVRFLSNQLLNDGD